MTAQQILDKYEKWLRKSYKDELEGRKITTSRDSVAFHRGYTLKSKHAIEKLRELKKEG